MSEPGTRTGLTWRVMLILIGVILIFVPLNIYSTFLIGTTLGTVAVFFVTLLTAELVRLSGESLTRQEALFLYYAASWGAAALPIYWLIIYRSYYVHSPLAWSVKLNGVPIAELVPEWMCPKYYSPAHALRTLFQAEFLLPLLIYTIYTVIGLVADIGLSAFAAHIFVERLKYPYPFSDVDVSISTFISERDPATTGYFLVFFIVGLMYGLLVYVPYMSGRGLIPIPFIDLTNIIQEWLPGAAFAIPTVLSSYIGGMLFPFKAATWALITSATIWLVLNSLFTTSLSQYAPEWAEEYIKGMGLVAVQNRSMLRLWFGPMLGFSLAIVTYAVLMIAGELKMILQDIKSRGLLQSSVIEPRTALLLFIAGSTASVLLYHILVPEIPVWIPIVYVFVISSFSGIISAASAGKIAFGLPPYPFTWHSLVYLTTPQRIYEAFAFDPPRAGGGTASFCQQVRACLRVGANPRDLIKIWVIGALLANGVGLLALDFFWRIAPIPSSAYPMTFYMMLSNSYIDTMLTGGMLNINIYNVGIPYLLLLVILFLGSSLEARGLFFSCLGLIYGLYAQPYVALAMFLGSVIGNFVMTKAFGRDRWQRIRGYVIAGEICGEGFTLLIGATLNLILKSGWLWPW